MNPMIPVDVNTTNRWNEYTDRTGSIMQAAQVIAPEDMMHIDNGGRRMEPDRRLFSYNGYLPERRSGDERRSGLDRRKIPRCA